MTIAGKLYDRLRAKLGVVCLIILLIASHVVFDPSFDDLRGKSFDAYQQLSPRGNSASSVVIVGVDDETIGVEGRWPWPRNRIADLIAAIHGSGVSVLGIDVLFSEPDESPGGVARDDLLARTIASSPTILATSIGDFPGSKIPQTSIGWAVVGNGNAEALPWQPGIIASTATIRAGAAGLGIVRSVSDSDGVVRTVPLVWAAKTADQLSLWPAFSLELARVYRSGTGYALRVRPSGFEALKLGDTIIPLSNGGAVWLWEQAAAIPRVSALDVMAGKAGDVLKGKIAILSVNALGVDKFHTTPTVAARSGAEIHAVLTNQLLDGKFLSEPADAKTLERLWFLVSALLLLAASYFFANRLWLLVTAGLALCLAPLLAGYTAYLQSAQLYEPVQPAVGLAAVALAEVYSLFRESDARRRQLSRQFSQYLSPNVVAMLSETRRDLTTSAEKREITVLMMDMRGFTSSSESLPADEINATVNRFLTLASQEIFKRDGTIDKFMGDAILAFWNAPVDQADHTDRALNAVLAIRASLATENVRREKDGKPPIRVGAGIETGICSVGNFGSDIRFDYTAIGSSVNMSARLESATKATGCPVLLGPGFAQRHVDGIEPVGKIELSGFANPVQVFTPVGLKPAASGQGASKKRKA
ncbi:MAG: adenylate/guanylate cyclase domain-containing protein [Pseudomonadota bacterium]